MPHPRVTIVVAAYNGERFLRESLESAFAQDYDSFEVVLVDDGSVDRTAEIAASFPLRYVRQENAGLPAARNAGLALARGELIAFLDDDDILPPDKLRVQVDYLDRHPDVGCVLGRQEWIVEDGVEPPPLQRDPLYGELGGIQMVSAMIRKRVLDDLGGFDPTYRYAEDRDLFVRLREHGVEIAVLPDLVLRKRLHGANMTADPPTSHPLLRSLREKLERERTVGRRPAAETSVSVIIGVYNGARYLAEAIDSVLAQTHPVAELIVVDDGSTDASGDIAESYGAPVRCIRQENGGMAAARNRAVPEATGDYLAFLDADDRFCPEKLRCQLAVFDSDPDLDVVYGHVTEFLSPDLDDDARALLRAPVADVPWPTPNLMLVKRESFLRVGMFSTELKVGIGVDWYARAGELGLRSAVPPVVVLERRLHADNNGIRQRQSKPMYLHVLKQALDRRRLSAGEHDDAAS